MKERGKCTRRKVRRKKKQEKRKKRREKRERERPSEQRKEQGREGQSRARERCWCRRKTGDWNAFVDNVYHNIFKARNQHFLKLKTYSVGKKAT
ncbi:hypothetical protein HOLleu_28390 [Holothuria leucospilota]|uniref:Uncharacterized protein n=1 Tax=Holothuria leucospilota TaxID=206669 RepID=A0A9Q1BLW6_HOLLE|nr:hypothetical protein HOLleu_28390 [Holothuria leucospilota]